MIIIGLTGRNACGKTTGGPCVVDSIRHPAEVEVLKKAGSFSLFHIVARVAPGDHVRSA